MTLTATGSALQFVERLEAEPTSISLVNDRDKPTRVFFGVLNDGVTAARFEAALKKGFPAFFPLITAAGSTVKAQPGESATVTIQFPEGRYVVAGEPFAKMDPYFFRVAKAAGASVEEPEADYEVSEGEYFIEMPTEVTTGKVSFEITNVGAESHELILSNKGDTFKEIVVAADKKGLATIAPAPGGRLWTEFNLRPGKYTAVCYIPDAETGKPHVRLGMKADFIVK